MTVKPNQSHMIRLLIRNGEATLSHKIDCQVLIKDISHHMIEEYMLVKIVLD